jgi:competence ComEA-like helix-hairpin-helix protein
MAAAAIAFEARTAKAADPSPELQAVQMVCGRCHTTALFMNETRSWDRWNDVFADMTQRGAKGTDEQLARVTTFFLENLTLVNINSSPAEELTGVLGVSDQVADEIIARRGSQPFKNIADLRMIPGVDPATLEKRKSRILF